MASHLRTDGVVVAVILTLAYAALSSAAAQEKIGKLQQPIQIKQEVFVANASGQELLFQLSCDDSRNAGSWQRNKLAANTSTTYECASLPRVFIRVTTGNRTVEYRLQSRKRYYLNWNPSRGVWDVFAYKDQ